MNADIFAVISSAVEFALFWVLHVLIFRYVGKQQILKWISYLFLTVSLTAAYAEWHLVSAFSIIPVTQIAVKLFVLAVVFILFALYTFIYIINIFGAIESAIRVRLLNMVAETGSRGLRKTVLMKKYNKNIIIRKRLLRLVSSGELAVENNQYRINKRISLIFIPVYITEFMHRIYGLNNNLSKIFCDL